MQIQIFQVDAFSERVFGGNYAAVCPLADWPDDDLLRAIAAENNLPETAFFVRRGGQYHLRWFTPEIEMDLCGHATLAAAHVLFQHLNHSSDEVVFQSASGPLVVKRRDQLFEMDFPARPPQPAPLPDVIARGIGRQPQEVLKARDYVLVYENEAVVRNIAPDVALLNTINLDPGGIIVTAPGDAVDFVSRFFTPQASIFEDPVTGSAHCSLTPYWASRLGKNQLRARQISQRGGALFCTHKGERVLIAGHATTYLKGIINI